MRFIVALAVLTLSATTAYSQQSVDARTRAIVASFNKSKHVVKSRHGVTREKYKDIRSEPALRSDAASYTGTYKVYGLEFALALRVAHDGSVEGNGTEPLDGNPALARTFTISGRVDGALLTATKIYSNGARERLEGVFINSTSRESPNDTGTTMFGIGVVSGLRDIGGVTTDKLFYQLVK
jgi:hypothetical protein